MEDVSAWEFLGRHVGTIIRLLCRLLFAVRRLAGRGGRDGWITRVHLLTADDTSAIGHFREFSFCGVGIAPVHVAGSIVIADERAETGNEGARGDKDIADDVKGQTIER